MYLDSNVLIRWIEGGDEIGLFLMENAAAGLLRAFTSEFTLAEVLVGPIRSGNEDLVAIYDDVFGWNDLLEVVPLDRALLRRSAHLCADLSNKGIDAVHVATAEFCRCKVFLSSDARIRVPDGMAKLTPTQFIKGTVPL